MIDLETNYHKGKKLVLAELDKKYLQEKENSSDVKHTIKKNIKEIEDKAYKLYRAAGFSVNAKIKELETIVKENKKKSFNECLNLATKSNSPTERKEIIKTISTVKAFQEFVTKLKDEKKVLFPKKEKGEPSIKNPQFTTSRQVLAVHFLFKALGVRNIDKTEQARFIQFLTGKEAGNNKIQNTTIYKKVCSPFKHNDNEFKKDLKYIKPMFEKLGMMNVVDLIDKEL